MRHTNGPQTLALSVLAILSMMAFMAAGAQAEWRIEGKGIAANETIGASAVTEIGIKVPSLELSISCADLITDNGRILSGTGDWDFEGHLWDKCSTSQGGKTLTGCKPLEPIVAKIKGTLLLHSSLTYILGEFDPSTVIRFSEETCALPSENLLNGTFVEECLNEKRETGSKLCETEMATHFIQPAPEKSFPEFKLTFGKNSASINGTDAWKLSGTNAGKKWSAVV
jgi:hypothetical protein